MYTYTTPTITCTLTGLELSQVDYVRIAIESKGYSLVRVVPAADIDTETGNTAIELTQEETAALGKGQVAIQARVRYLDGTVQATNKVLKDMYTVLDEVVI
jgi:hypothetical protein